MDASELSFANGDYAFDFLKGSSSRCLARLSCAYELTQRLASLDPSISSRSMIWHRDAKHKQALSCEVLDSNRLYGCWAGAIFIAKQPAVSLVTTFWSLILTDCLPCVLARRDSWREKCPAWFSSASGSAPFWLNETDPWVMVLSFDSDTDKLWWNLEVTPTAVLLYLIIKNYNYL